MTKNKTVATGMNVKAFLASLDDSQQCEDCERLIEMMTGISGSEPTMWGASIIGFGTMQYRTADGKTHDWMRIGFSPRKGKLTLYITVDAKKYKNKLDAAGKYKIGKGCIYLRRLDDVDTDILAGIIRDAYDSGWGSSNN